MKLQRILTGFEAGLALARWADQPEDNGSGLKKSAAVKALRGFVESIVAELRVEMREKMMFLKGWRIKDTGFDPDTGIGRLISDWANDNPEAAAELAWLERELQ